MRHTDGGKWQQSSANSICKSNKKKYLINLMFNDHIFSVDDLQPTRA